MDVRASLPPEPLYPHTQARPAEQEAGKTQGGLVAPWIVFRTTCCPEQLLGKRDGELVRGGAMGTLSIDGGHPGLWQGAALSDNPPPCGLTGHY